MALDVSRVITDAHDDPILCVAVNKQRRELYSGAQDGLIKVWEAETGNFVRNLEGHRGWVTDLMYYASYRYLVSCGVDGSLIVWNDKGKEIYRLENLGTLFCMAWEERRKHVIVGGNSVVHIYKLLKVAKLSSFEDSGTDERSRALKLVTSIHSHTDIVRGVACSESGKIFSASYDKCICVYDAEKPKEQYAKYQNMHAGAICQLDLDPENNWIITGSYDGSVKIWSHEGRNLDVFDGLADTVTGLSYIKSTKNYWITGKGKRLVAFDPRSPLNITEYVGETSRFDEFSVVRVHQSPNEPNIVVGITAGITHDLVIWRYNPSAALRVLAGHRDWVESLCVVPTPEGQNEEVYSVGSDGLILRWKGSSQLNTDLFQIEDEFLGHEGAILCSCYTTDLGMLVTGSEDCTLKLWPVSEPVDEEPTDGAEHEPRTSRGRTGPSRGSGVDDGGESLELKGHEARINDVCDLGDHVLASVSHDMTLRFWDLHTRHEMYCVHRAHDNPIHSVEHAMEREEVATAATEPTVKIWRSFKPFTLKGVLAGHNGDVTAVKWCHWRMLWITAADDHTIRLWDPEMGETLRCLSIRGEAITAMMLDPDNQCLVAAMRDRKIRLFDVAQLEGLKDRFGQWVGEEGNDVSNGGGEGELEAELSGAPSMSSASSMQKNYFGGAKIDDMAMPVTIYSGHTDLVRSIVYVPGKRQYFSAGWDKSIRVWYAPNHSSKEGDAHKSDAAGGSTMSATQLTADLSEDFVSTYEQMNPLVPPASLRDTHGAQMLKLTRGRKGEKTEEDLKQEEAEAQRAKEMKTSLGRRLNELEAKLNEVVFKKAGMKGNADVGSRRKSTNLGRNTRPSVRQSVHK